MVNGDVNIPTGMRKAINDCKKSCEAITATFEKEINEKAVPKILYHYTDQKGMLGILKSGKIHVTNIFGLNDPSEIRHGLIQASDILEKEAKRMKHPAAKVFADTIINAMKTKDINKIAGFYVACFSRDKDDLGQWRAYGDDGRGFVIGFDSKLLIEVFEKQDGLFETFPITYNDKKLRTIYRKIVKAVFPLIKRPEIINMNNITISEFLKELTKNLTIFIFRVAVFFKHKAYKNEQEYRFLHIHATNDPIKDIQYREKPNSVISFIELNWKIRDQNILQEVVIGPAADKKLAMLSANNCLSAAGFDPDSIVINYSDIPYRRT